MCGTAIWMPGRPFGSPLLRRRPPARDRHSAADADSAAAPAFTAVEAAAGRGKSHTGQATEGCRQEGCVDDGLGSSGACGRKRKGLHEACVQRGPAFSQNWHCTLQGARQALEAIITGGAWRGSKQGVAGPSATVHNRAKKVPASAARRRLYSCDATQNLGAVCSLVRPCRQRHGSGSGSGSRSPTGRPAVPPGGHHSSNAAASGST